MGNFILYSIIGSVIFTIVVNVLPLLFPKTTDKLQDKIEENASRSIDQHEGQQQRVKFLFPWKSMLIVSVILTVIVNLINYLSR